MPKCCNHNCQQGKECDDRQPFDGAGTVLSIALVVYFLAVWLFSSL